MFSKFLWMVNYWMPTWASLVTTGSLFGTTEQRETNHLTMATISKRLKFGPSSTGSLSMILWIFMVRSIAYAIMRKPVSKPATVTKISRSTTEFPPIA